MRLALAAALAAACFLAAPAAFAVVGAPPSARESESDLGKLMGQMNKHFKALKKEVGEADKKDSVAEHFAKIAELTEKCKAVAAPDTVKTEDDKKAYAAGLDATIAAAKAGAEAAKAGKTDDAKKAYEDLKKIMKDGHDKFKKED